MFISRQPELTLLEQAYQEPKSHFTICYGRRRIGKTALLKEFVKKKERTFYFAALKTTQKKQMRNFLKEWAAFVHDPLIATAAVKTWKDVFDVIKNRLGPKKPIVVFDEFQWMCGKDPSLLSVLQHVWDQDWQNDNCVHLILCGSSISFMTTKVLSEKSPLFGRRTQSFEVRPFQSQESLSFLKTKDRVEAATFLMTFGGIPAYLLLYHSRQSIERNINNLAFCRDSYFVNELKFVLSEQLKQPAIYFKILRLLAQRPYNLTEIAHRVHAGTGATSFNMHRLRDIGIVQEHKPLLLDETAKTLVYKISDEYTRFYFSFIQPNVQQIQQNPSSFIFDSVVANKWDSFLGRCFEDFCHKNISRILAALEIESTFLRSGTYWHTKTSRFHSGVQIDLVIETKDRTTYLGECKWSREKIDYSIMKELDEKVQNYPNPKKHKLRKLLIASSGVTPHLQNHPEIDVVTLEDFF